MGANRGQIRRGGSEATDSADLAPVRTLLRRHGATQDATGTTRKRRGDLNYARSRVEHPCPVNRRVQDRANAPIKLRRCRQYSARDPGLVRLRTARGVPSRVQSLTPEAPDQPASQPGHTAPKRLLECHVLIYLELQGSSRDGLGSRRASDRRSSLKRPEPSGIGIPMMMHSLTPTISSVRPWTAASKR